MIKQIVVYTYNEILFSHKKEQSTKMCNNLMNLENITLNKFLKSQQQNITHHMTPFVWSTQIKQIQRNRKIRGYSGDGARAEWGVTS